MADTLTAGELATQVDRAWRAMIGHVNALEERTRAAREAAGGLYVGDDDRLLVTSFNSAASVAVTVSGTIRRRDGALVAFESRHVPNTDRTIATSEILVGGGWLQSVTAIASSGAPLAGQAFVRVDVIRGRASSPTVLATVLQGPVTAIQRLAWPGSPLRSSTDVPGAVRVVTGTDPAAGEEVSETVPTGARWRLLAMRVPLISDATAITRTPSLLIDDGVNVFASMYAVTGQAASIAQAYTVAAAQFSSSAALNSLIPINTASAILLAGHRIRTSTVNLQAGDNYGAPILLVEEWLEGN